MAAAQQPQSSLRTLLQELHLAQYAEQVEEAGFDDVSWLKEQPAHWLHFTFCHLGMREGHVLRLLGRLGKWRAADVGEAGVQQDGTKWAGIFGSAQMAPPATANTATPQHSMSPPGPLMLSSPGSNLLLSSQQLGSSESLDSPRVMSMPHSALYLEDRLKTVSLGIVAVVAVVFVCWYLQSVLKLVTIAMLLAVLLEPLVDLLSVPPARPPAWLDALSSTRACSCVSGLAPDCARIVHAVVEFLCVARLPRAAAILLTLLLVLAIGSLLVVILYDTFYQFIDHSHEYVEVGEHFVLRLKSAWKRSSFGSSVDVDALLNALLDSAGDTSVLQEVLVQSVSLVGSAVANMAVCMLMWIFLVMTPPPQAERRRKRGGAQSAQAQTRIYLRWKAGISLGKALASGILYLSLALPLWPIVAIFVFWLNWIPVFGSLLAIALPLPLALADPHSDWIKATVLVALPAAMHIVVDNLVDVQVMAQVMMLHPLSILLGLFTAKILWGVVGMVLSVPLLAALKTNLAGTAHPYARALALLLEGKWRDAALISGNRSPNAADANADVAKQSAWSNLRASCSLSCCAFAYARGESLRKGHHHHHHHHHHHRHGDAEDDEEAGLGEDMLRDEAEGRSNLSFRQTEQQEEQEPLNSCAVRETGTPARLHSPARMLGSGH